MVVLFVFDVVDELDSYVRSYVENWDFFLKVLFWIGLFFLVEFDGVFYFYCDVLYFIEDLIEFCVKMLEECGVVCVLGNDFDMGKNVRCVCLFYVGMYVDIVEVMDCLVSWFFIGN